VLLGHSLGEVVAIVAAGAFTVADGARLVIRRVQVIEQLGQVDGAWWRLAPERTGPPAWSDC